MNFVRRLNSERLASVLEETIRQENEGQSLTRIFCALQNQGSDLITPSVRDKTIRWIWLLNNDFEFLPETFALTVSIFDRFLSHVKARPKYARCIGVTAYFLAIKTLEEDENIPSLEELVQVSECGCSTSDVLRMERIILNKLEWSLHSATPLAFLQLYHAMAFSMCSSPAKLLQIMTERLEECLCKFSCTQFKGSVLSLALIESCSPGWLTVVIKLQKVTQVDFNELMKCREMLISQDNSYQNLRKLLTGVQPSLATIPEVQEEPEMSLPGLMQAKPMATLPVVPKCDYSAVDCDVQMHEELKRMHQISIGLLHDNEKLQAKRHKSKQVLSCGLQSRQSCDISTAAQSLRTFAI